MQHSFAFVYFLNAFSVRNCGCVDTQILTRQSLRSLLNLHAQGHLALRYVLLICFLIYLHQQHAAHIDLKCTITGLPLARRLCSWSCMLFFDLFYWYQDRKKRKKKSGQISMKLGGRMGKQFNFASMSASRLKKTQQEDKTSRENTLRGKIVVFYPHRKYKRESITSNYRIQERSMEWRGRYHLL